MTMLRIETRTESSRQVTYALSGQITREHLPELAALLTAARDGGKRVTLDLANVVLVDRDFVGFLVSGAGAGAELAHCPAYVLSWLRCERKGEEKRPS